MKMRTFKIMSGLLGCLLACAIQHASANLITYSLGTGNSSLSPTYPGPYGSVDVNLTDSTHATITFTGGAAGGFTYIFGGAQVVNVNVNATSWTVSSLTGSGVGPLSNGGVNTADGFGSFNQTFDSFDGFSSAGNTVSFILTDTSGTWADAANVLTGNSSGNILAAHIFVVDSTGANPATGFASTGGTPGTPDGGSTILLLGLAMVGIGSARRVFTRK